MNELDLAYAAGIIDGEGCISVKNKKARKENKAVSTPCIYLCMAYRRFKVFGISSLDISVSSW